jgi:predicted RNA-binding protein with PUA domain
MIFITLKLFDLNQDDYKISVLQNGITTLFEEVI